MDGTTRKGKRKEREDEDTVVFETFFSLRSISLYNSPTILSINSMYSSDQHSEPVVSQSLIDPVYKQLFSLDELRLGSVAAYLGRS
jgi:hypothetical protein